MPKEQSFEILETEPACILYLNGVPSYIFIL